MVIPNRLSEIPGVQQTVLSEVERFGYDAGCVFAIRLAMEEALSNAIRHGNCGDPAKHVTIEYRVDSQRVEITICDEGCGFEPTAVPDPTLDENLTRPCGRGVLLMRAYMSEVRFNKAGNCVTLVKLRGHRPCCAPNPQNQPRK